jgi:Circadian oscillating protein COP23
LIDDTHHFIPFNQSIHREFNNPLLRTFSMSQSLTRLFFSIASVSVLSVGLAPSNANADTTPTSYSCGSFNGVPSTMASTKNGKNVPVIQYKSRHFNASGWTPERRCQEVSQRFDSLSRQGLLRQAFLTTGRKNGQNIICVSPSEGSACMDNGILFTLRPESNPARTLRDLTEWAKYQTGPLSQTTSSRPYYSLDEILETAEGQLTSEKSRISPEGTVGEPSGESLMP